MANASPDTPSSPWSLHFFYTESEEKERERGFMSERSIETAYCVAAVAPTLRNQANTLSWDFPL